MSSDQDGVSPAFEWIARADKVVAILRNTLAAHGLATEIERMDIQVHEKYINEITGNQSKLSNLIYDYMFPRQATPIEVWHYTKPDTFKSILKRSSL